MNRPDISPNLFHFTREKKNTPARTALESLCAILKSGVIQGSAFGVRGRGNPSATCFTEAPVYVLNTLTTPPEVDLPPHGYRPYGIGISKRAAFDAGARPVIYLPEAEMSWVPIEEQWRLVQMNAGSEGGLDFGHEREWRKKGSLDMAQLPGIVVLVWSQDDAKAIRELDCGIQDKIRAIYPMKYLA